MCYLLQSSFPSLCKIASGVKIKDDDAPANWQFKNPLRVQYPPTDRWNAENRTSLPMSPDVRNSNGTMPNMSSNFALGRDHYHHFRKPLSIDLFKMMGVWVRWVSGSGVHGSGEGRKWARLGPDLLLDTSAWGADLVRVHASNGSSGSGNIRGGNVNVIHFFRMMCFSLQEQIFNQCDEGHTCSTCSNLY